MQNISIYSGIHKTNLFIALFYLDSHNFIANITFKKCPLIRLALLGYALCLCLASQEMIQSGPGSESSLITTNISGPLTLLTTIHNLRASFHFSFQFWKFKRWIEDLLFYPQVFLSTLIFKMRMTTLQSFQKATIPCMSRRTSPMAIFCYDSRSLTRTTRPTELLSHGESPHI